MQNQCWENQASTNDGRNEAEKKAFLIFIDGEYMCGKNVTLLQNRVYGILGPLCDWLIQSWMFIITSIIQKLLQNKPNKS